MFLKAQGGYTQENRNGYPNVSAESERVRETVCGVYVPRCERIVKAQGVTE